MKKKKEEGLRRIISKGESLLTSEIPAEFYTGLTRIQKRNLSLVGLKLLAKAFDGNPSKVAGYLKNLEAPS